MSPPPPTKNYAQLRTTSHKYAQLRAMVDFIVLSIQLVFMVLGISYSRVLYNNKKYDPIFQTHRTH